MSYNGRWIEIQSYKHDGSIHRQWDRGLVLEDNDDFIVVASRRAKVIEANGRRWFTKEPAITFFSKKEWFNVICMLKDKGISYYCNIASPSIIDKNKIKYIDYDLDVKLLADKSIRLLDEKEYKNHKKRYNYSPDLARVLEFEAKEIERMMIDGDFPFIDEEIKAYYAEYLLKLEGE
ncbi:MAG: DUF402 domain-containing protein [Erysipelotrichaceae bacterium]|jgi:protein associated with RNAse G/E|nr:DUF402 domain-containing protein [Erysipelotrichaceae bacterium]